MRPAATVWITRTRPGAEATAARVRALGMAPFVAPLLEVRFVEGDAIDLEGVSAVAFTSANGLRAFVSRSSTRDLPVFAVGKGTAAAARTAGFVDVRDGDGDVLDLADRIAASPLTGGVLHPGAEELAADLVAELSRRGVPARGVVVYRTQPAVLTEADRAQAVAADYVLLHSPKAAAVLRDLKIEGPRAVCLSEAVGAALASGARASSPRSGGIIAEAPTEDALLHALREAAETADKPVRLLTPLYWMAMMFCLICFAGAATVVMKARHAPPALGAPARAR